MEKEQKYLLVQFRGGNCLQMFLPFLCSVTSKYKGLNL